MTKFVLIFYVIVVILSNSLALNPLPKDKPAKETTMKKLVHLLSKLARSNLHSQRRLNEDSLNKARGILNLLKKNVGDDDMKKALREGDNTNGAVAEAPVRNSQEHAQVVEKELSSALHEKSSALLDKPYVEKKGINDFLVMKDNFTDPFVTVVPNAIYYDIEKKCVNWLDNCSLDGIRAKLFQVIRSPYK